jgi:protein O-mannosyl-transferase
MRRNALICLWLAGITLAVYWPAANYDFVRYDDPLFFVDNPEVQSGLNWHSFVWAMSTVLVANWHPVTSLSFVLDHQCFGTNPGAEHLVNIAFHAVNAVLLFLVLNRMTKTVWRSAIVAAIFAWHPLRVESVAWISERKDVLFAFFLLLALCSYVRFAESPKAEGSKGKVFYVLSLLFFALSLMSKAMAVTLPFLLLLLDFWPLKRTAIDEWRVKKNSTAKKLLLEKLPFFALAAVFCVVTFEVQKKFTAMTSLDQVGVGARVSNMIASYLGYLGKMFWPVDLAVIYPHPSSSFATSRQWPDWQIGIGAILLLAISAFFGKMIFRKPYLAVGWFWFLGTMIPVIGLVQVGETAMADRYTYFPLIGPAISLVWWVSEIGKRKIFPEILAVVSLIALMILTHRQIQFWKSTTSLFGHTVEVTGTNPSAQCGLASGLEQAGRPTEAMVHYRVALGIIPRYRDAEYNLARLLAKKGYLQEAAENYLDVVSYSPTDVDAQFNLAVALAHLGRMAESVQHLEIAVQYAPERTDALNNLAWTLATTADATVRDGTRAVQLAERACELTHYKITIYVGVLAAAYAEAGQFEDAMATAQKAIALAEKSGEQNLLQKNQELLELYRAHKPYRAAPEKLVPAAQ